MVLNCCKVDRWYLPSFSPTFSPPVTIISAKWRMYAARKRYRKLRWAGESRLCVSICQRHFSITRVDDLSPPSHLIRHSLEETDYSALCPEIQSSSCHCQKVHPSFVITSSFLLLSSFPLSSSIPSPLLFSSSPLPVLPPPPFSSSSPPDSRSLLCTFIAVQPLM